MSIATARKRRRKTEDAAPLLEEVLAGRVERVVFHNPENGYSVLRVSRDGADKTVEGGLLEGLLDEDEIVAVGHLSRIRVGDEYEFRGVWKDHPKFGRQLHFSTFEVKTPSGRDGIVAYLASVATGVGPVRAGMIVDALGEDALERIQSDPAVLDGLGFLTDAQRSEIRQHLEGNWVMAELTALICLEAGVTPGLATRIYRVYGAESVEKVKENPYILAEDVWGVGFLTADKVARAVGVAPDSPFRVEAAVDYVLKEAQNEGHCYLRPRDIVPRVKKLLGKACGVGMTDIANAVSRMVESERLIREDSSVYTRALHDAEVRLAERMRSLVEAGMEAPDGLDEVLARVEASLDIECDDWQREAIRTALRSPLSIVTGGPGVGKSLTIRAIADLYEQLYPDKPIYLAAPTGRAAKRITELTGREAKTIHRLLEYHPEGGFRRDDLNPLEPGLLVVDEFSMCDLELAEDLFSAIPEGMQVVLVGDVDQLPSVGPGSVLRDSILSSAVPVTRLQFVYRQTEGSEIHLWAHLIKDGMVPNLVSSHDVTVIECPEQEDAVAAAVTEARKAVKKYGLMGFQVLAPMKKGTSGVGALNDAVRAAVNPHGGELRLGGTVYRMGDKVMVVKNNYNLDVFNGDLGLVTGFRMPNEPGGPAVVVDVQGKGIVDFGADHADILTLAYASTVHKAQGSEFPLVIVVLTRGHYIMLQRNLLYTAVTRAKERLVVIHQPGSIERAVENDRIAERYSRLCERLRAE